ncbi:MAG: hypothetical protein RLZZ158_2117 [Cyanobacteriota bacterium]|jgi:hypothetical protein
MIAVRFASVLFGPPGSLSGDGQLREVFEERIRGQEPAGRDLWFVSADQFSGQLRAALAQRGPRSTGPLELLISSEPHLLVWLQVRFGGELLEHMPLLGAGFQDLDPRLPPAAAPVGLEAR